MELENREHGIHTISEIRGEIDLFNISEFKELVFSVTNGEYKSLILDMKNAYHFDSTIIGALISAKKKMDALNCQFALLHVNTELLDRLRQSKLIDFFTIYSSEEDIPL